ncbi:MAG: 50S ribosomal protein L19 [Candidatus Colwellbacteria bacterium]|nr:50S ribosomal protein L19 [Candidatus Colwellbacteria bacterium]
MIDQETIKKLKPGTKVKVYEKQGQFEGIILARKHGTEPGATFTVRAKLADVGVEKVYPIYSPSIKKVEILTTPKRKVRRAKLYYLRNLSERKIRQKLGV